MTSGFTAFYLAIYCVHYFITKLDIEGAGSTFLYFGYTSVMVFCFFLLTGECIGFHQAAGSGLYCNDVSSCSLFCAPVF